MKIYTQFIVGALAVLSICSSLAAEVPEDWSRIYLGSCPSVDANGRTFVFEWNDTLWMADVHGGWARRLGSGSSTDSWPVISPDGTKVIFASDREGGHKVFEFDLTQDEIRQVSYHSETTTPRSWCADGKSILCVGYRDSSDTKTAARVIRVPTDRRATEEIVFDYPANDPVMSPDGASILFTRRGDDPYRKRPHSVGPSAGQIWRYTLATGAFDPMVETEYDSRNPIWRPKGDGFYYLSAKNGQGVRNVWFHDIAKKSDTQLTHFTDDHVFQPTLSADGQTMIFRQAFDFWRFNPLKPEVAPERIILRPEPGYAPRPNIRRRLYDVCWNNDSEGDVTFCDNGTQIAFTTGGDLYVMDTVVCEPKLVKGDTRTHERECVFSPDGGALYYLSDRGDTASVMKAEPEDPSKPWWENFNFKHSEVVSDTGQRMGLSISPEGSTLAWYDPAGIFTFVTTNGVRISRGPAATKAYGYAWSPDGKWIVAQLEDEFANSDVWIISVDGQTKPYNLSRNFKYDGEPAWSPDGKMISFVSERPELGAGKFLCYVYLDRTMEEIETFEYDFDKSRRAIREDAVVPEKYASLNLPGEEAANKRRDLPFEIHFDDLAERVRVVKVSASMPFFGWDSRTIAFATANHTTDYICVPNQLTPQKLFNCMGVPRAWVQKGNRVLWIVNRLPAIGEQTLGFNVYQNTDIRDYQELAFRTAWARIRDIYYDPGTHGADWPAVGRKYLEPARNALSHSVFVRVMNMMLGELDSSHLGFYSTDISNKEWVKKIKTAGWTEQTAHLGLRFEQKHVADGWVVRDVIPGGPADRLGYNIAPGDVVTAIDSVPLTAEMDPTLVLNGPAKRKVRVTVRHQATGDVETVMIPSYSYAEARNQVGKENIKKLRRKVHESSEERLGYLNIDQMNWESLWLFQHEVFSEGYGRDGLVIDVRYNIGGFTADQMLQILMGADHSRAVTRTGGAGYLFGYWGRPVWSKPIVVLCNERTASNGEIFSHAIKTLKRGKLVGRQTGGGVIGTQESSLLDLGGFRNAKYGWFLLDGTDFEHNGAIPDYIVDDLPGEVVKGIDAQLDKAIEVLNQEVEVWRKENPPIDFKYAR